MKKGLLLLVFLSTAMMYAQIREYVCVVYPQYSDNVRQFITDSGQKLSEAGYRDLGTFLKDDSMSGFGSGFLYTDSNGESFIVTNRHVVADAVSAKITFENSDGSKNEYVDSSIVAIDVELDLALIKLNPAFIPRKGLMLAVKLPVDGDDVWSAGYPGLGKTPSWQLGKGTITNISSRVPLLVDPARATLIQHSAPVDPGNSGGPLLVVNKGKPGGYEVVGINTWKAFFRQATNLAVPAAKVQSFIDQNRRSLSVKESQDLVSMRVKDFCAVSAIKNSEDKNERIRKIARFLSQTYVINNGYADLKKALLSAPSSVRGEVIDTITDGSILDAMRLASAWQIDIAVSAEEQAIPLSALPIEAKSNIIGQIPVIFTIAPTSTLETLWKANLGSWEIDTFSLLSKTGEGTKDKDPEAKKTEKKVSSHLTIESPYTISIMGEYRKDTENKGFGISFLINNNLLAYGFGVYRPTVTYMTDAFTPTEETTTAVRVLLLARLQIPINTDNVTYMPYADVRLGLQKSEDVIDQSGLLTGYGVGLQLALGENTHWLINAGWYWEDLNDLVKVDGFSVGLGIGL